MMGHMRRLSQAVKADWTVLGVSGDVNTLVHMQVLRRTRTALAAWA